MQITVKDLLELDIMKGFIQLTNLNEFNGPVSKIGILDYEFTRQGYNYTTESHWQPGEFVLTTFSNARENPRIIMNAVKQLRIDCASGIAIKNVFELEIPKNVIRYANAHNFPIFIFKDRSVFFEDIVIATDRLLRRVNNRARLEQFAELAVNGNLNISSQTQFLNEVMPSLNAPAAAIYFRPSNNYIDVASAVNRLESRLSISDGMYVIPYKKGYFFAGTVAKAAAEIYDTLTSKLELFAQNCIMGVSDFTNFNSEIGLIFRQAYIAEQYAYIKNLPRVNYGEIGAYRLYLEYYNEQPLRGLYHMLLSRFQDMDENGRNIYLDTILLYEECDGNIKEMAALLNSHENTVRYRLKQLAELMGLNAHSASFAEELLVSARLYRIRQMKFLTLD